MDPIDTPGFPCPECRERLVRNGKEIKGFNRIGNRRRLCDTCNNFAAAVRRGIAKRLLEQATEEELAKLRLQVERDLYPGVIERWNVSKGLPR